MGHELMNFIICQKHVVIHSHFHSENANYIFEKMACGEGMIDKLVLSDIELNSRINPKNFSIAINTLKYLKICNFSSINTHLYNLSLDVLTTNAKKEVDTPFLK